MLFKRWTIPVAVIANSAGKKIKKTGVNKVPKPKPEKKVRIEMINCEENETNAQLAARFGVKGYPTIIAVVNGEKQTYEGADRSSNGFVSWLKSLF